MRHRGFRRNNARALFITTSPFFSGVYNIVCLLLYSNFRAAGKGFCLQSFAKFEFELWLFNNCKFVEENNQFEAFRIKNNLPPLLFLSRFCNIVCLLLYLNFRVAGKFCEIEIEHKLLNNWKSVDCRIKKQSLPPLLFCQGFATSIVYWNIWIFLGLFTNDLWNVFCFMEQTLIKNVGWVIVLFTKFCKIWIWTLVV